MILKAITANPLSSPKDVASGLGMTVANAEMCLFNLFKQGLLARVKGDGLWKKPCFSYTVTEKGLTRLAYLTEQP